jgi:hypothetical protein
MLRISIALICLAGVAAMNLSPSRGAAPDKTGPIKVGIIGTDTSHVPAFTKAMNDPDAKDEMAAVEVVAAFPGGSADIPESIGRVEKYVKELRDLGVKQIVGSVEELLPLVDVVLLESVDGRPHLAQAIPVIKAGKPLFIDKPVAGTLADAIAIYDLAAKYKVPVFSSSSLRFSSGILGMRKDNRVGEVIGVDAFGPCHLEAHHPDLFWYGIHGTEILCTIMGTGCESVSRTQTDGGELVVGVWKGGRIGTFRGIREGKSDYGALVFGSKGIAPSGGYDGYKPLVVEIAKFFQSGKPPVSAEETLEIYTLMEAADESKHHNGASVKLSTVFEKAKAEAAKKVAEVK